MKFRFFVLFNLFFWIFCCGAAAVEVVLKGGELYASSGKIYLKDVADVINAPKSARDALNQIYVKRAAYPGKSVSVTRARVLNLVRRHYGDIKVSGPEIIYVETRKKIITGKEAAKAAVGFLKSRLPYDDEDVFIEVKSVRDEINVPYGKVLLKPKQDRMTRIKGNVIVPVEILVDGNVFNTFPVSVLVSVNAECLVASQDIARRTKVGADMFRTVKMDITYLPDDVISEPEMLKTRITRRGIPEGTVLLGSMFASIPMFERNQTVRAVAKRGEMEVETFGQALREGREGDSVKVKLETGKTVEGKVDEKGRVIIEF